ncbi:MAG: MCE family protein [Gemmatimonadaceae bacterium]|nr:MCE family protein [Gemmatimonadaceae bacterium]
MKQRSSDFMLGAIIVGAIALIVGVSLFLRETEIGGKRNRVTARFSDVGQVQVGNAVVIRGVKAGKVEAIELDANGWVQVRLALNKDIELPRDPVVLLGASSLFGEWQAMVMERSAAPNNRDVAAALVAASGEKGQLPGAVLPDVAQLTTVAGGIAGDVASVAQRFQVAFNDSAARELRASIRSVAQLSAELARTVRVQSRHLDTVSVDVRAGAADLSQAAEAFLRTVSRIDSATSAGEVRNIVSESEKAAGQVREASVRLNQLTQSMERTESHLRGVMARADSLLSKVDQGQGTLGLLVNDPRLYQNTDSLLRELRALLADVRKQPKRYFGVKIF